MTAPRKSAPAKVTTPVTAKEARHEAAEDVRRTASSTSEAVRETAKEAAEDTRSFLSRAGSGAQYVAIRTAQEVEKARKATKPYLVPVLGTAAFLVEPIGTLGVTATIIGAKVVRNRVRELAAEDTTLTVVDTQSE